MTRPKVEVLHPTETFEERRRRELTAELVDIDGAQRNLARRIQNFRSNYQVTIDGVLCWALQNAADLSARQEELLALQKEFDALSIEHNKLLAEYSTVS